MQTVLKLLIVIGELIQRYCDMRKQAKRDAQIEAIRKDPADEFLNEFGSVPSSADKATVSSSQTGVEVSSKE